MARTAHLRARLDLQGIALAVEGSKLQMVFVGAGPEETIQVEERLPASVNVFSGVREQDWMTNIPAFGKVRYKNLYPGIDALYGGTEQKLKSEFIVAAGADPNAIRFRYLGAQAVKVSGGVLIVEAGSGELRENAPFIYQIIQGQKKQVEGAYRISPDQTISFTLGAYDSNVELVIDPVLSYLSYIGGSGIDAVTGVAVDASSNIYICGYTESADLPISGAIQGGVRGVDGFVMKLNPAGTSLIYATYMGGSGFDQANGIAVDANGSAIIVGRTGSTDYPVVSAFQPTSGGGTDAFITKLSLLGNTILYSSYLGGGASDQANAVALDSFGSAYLTGDTSSTNFPFVSGVQPANHGRSDAFVAKVNSSGSLLYSTYLGGAGDEFGKSIAVDSSGAAYITGSSSSPNFPVVNGFQPVNGGGQDAFVAKLSPAGNALVYSTYLGGSGGTVDTPESGNGIAVDRTGAAVVVGSTASPNFPIQSAIQPVGGGTLDAFIAKLTPSGSGLIYSTYLGGSARDYATAVTLDVSGQAYVAGATASPDFPLVNALQSLNAGAYDAFVTKLNVSGSQFVFSTFLGGTGSEEALGMVRTATSDIWIAGKSTSIDLHTVAPLQASGGSEGSGLLIRIADPSPPWARVTPDAGSGVSQSLQITLTDQNGPLQINTALLLINSNAGTAAGCYLSFDKSQNSLALASDSGSTWSSYTLGQAATLRNSQCSVDVGSSSVAISGTDLVLQVVISLTAGFTGLKNIYVSAGNRDGLSSGLRLKGTWSWDGRLPPSAVVAPASGTGGSPVFQITFSDPNGFSDISSAMILVNSTLNGAAACFLGVYFSAGVVGLKSDTGTSEIAVPAGSTVTAQNSQCILNGSGITFTGSGNDIVLQLPLTFKTTFSGAKNLYITVADREGLAADWQLKGAWTAPGSLPPSAVVSPTSGTGNSQVFQITFSDPNGFSDISSAMILLNTTLNGASACFLGVYFGSGVVGLKSDTGTAETSVPAGSTVTAQNSQCVLSGSGLTFTASGNDIVLRLPLTFKSAFSGIKNVYVTVADRGGLAADWQVKGTWTVPGSLPPSAVVSPTSGTGNSQLFQFTFSDPNGFADISSAMILVNSTLNGASACFLGVYFSTGVVGLKSDTGTAETTIPAGSTVTAQNSQCIVSGSGMIFTSSGNNVVLQLPVTFKAAFSGAKNVYVTVADRGGLAADWQLKGAWTVPGSLPPSAVVSPTSGTGNSQTFQFTFSDPNGFSDISSAMILVNNTLNGASACFLGVYFSTGVIGLKSDTGTSEISVPAGSNVTAQNSQCILSGAGMTFTSSGNDIVLQLPLTFKTAFSGAKNVYVTVADRGGLAADWQLKGTWTVPGSLPPSAVVSPTGGTGSSGLFQFSFTDPNGFADISSAMLLINNTLNGASACFLGVYFSSGVVGLKSDTGTAEIAVPAGGTVTAQNSQCIVSGAGISFTSSGNTIVLQLPITFKTAFSGAKNVYVTVADRGGLAADWQLKGTWTVN